jgi:hypothetical protein
VSKYLRYSWGGGGYFNYHYQKVVWECIFSNQNQDLGVLSYRALHVSPKTKPFFLLLLPKTVFSSPAIRQQLLLRTFFVLFVAPFINTSLSSFLFIVPLSPFFFHFFLVFMKFSITDLPLPQVTSTGISSGGGGGGLPSFKI